MYYRKVTLLFVFLWLSVFCQPVLAVVDCASEYEVEVDWSGCDLSYRDLSNLDLSGANLQGTRFVGSYLVNSNFSGANLDHASFRGANISNVNFDDATATYADFRSVFYVAEQPTADNTNFEHAFFINSIAEVGFTSFDPDQEINTINKGGSVAADLIGITQSSTEQDKYAHYAIDDDQYSYALMADKNAWLRLDLGSHYPITEIKVLIEGPENEYGAPRGRQYATREELDIYIDSWALNSTGEPREGLNDSLKFSTGKSSSGRYIWIKDRSDSPKKIYDIEVKRKKYYEELTVIFTVSDGLYSISPVTHSTVAPRYLTNELINNGDFLQTTELLSLFDTRISSFSDPDVEARLETLKKQASTIYEVTSLIKGLKNTLDPVCVQASDLKSLNRLLPNIGFIKSLKTSVSNFINPVVSNCDSATNTIEKVVWPTITALKYTSLVIKETVPEALTLRHKQENLLTNQKNRLSDAYFYTRNIDDYVYADSQTLESISSTQLGDHQALSADFYAGMNSVDALAESGRVVYNTFTAQEPAINALQSTLSGISYLLAPVNTVLSPIKSVINYRKCFTVNLLFTSWDICFSVRSVLKGLSNVPFISSFNNWANGLIQPHINNVLNKIVNPIGSFEVDVAFPDWDIETDFLPSLFSQTNSSDLLFPLGDTNAWFYPSTPEPQGDYDGDGLTNTVELNEIYSSPYSLDSDNDGRLDQIEYNYSAFSLTNSHDGDIDSDGDGLTNQQEYLAGTDPDSKDTDEDGLDDYWEVNNSTSDIINGLGMDPNTAGDGALDFDDDGVTNQVEYENGSNIFSTDTDGDLLLDAEELLASTLLTHTDTDYDGVNDKLEVEHAPTLDPLDYTDILLGSFENSGFSTIEQMIYSAEEESVVNKPDFGYDFLSDEYAYLDTDGDGINDAYEDTYAGDLITLSMKSADNDTDGLTNIEEFAAGSHPLVSNNISYAKYGYQVSNSLSDSNVIFSPADISSSADGWVEFDSSSSERLPIEYTFNALGKWYSRVYVSPKGAIIIGDDSCEQRELDKEYAAGLCLAPLFEQTPELSIDTNLSRVYYKLTDNELIIQFHHYFQGYPDLPLRYKVTLDTHSGIVQFDYMNTVNPADLTRSRGAVHLVGLFQNDASELLYSQSEASLANSAFAVRFSPQVTFTVDKVFDYINSDQTSRHQVTVNNNTGSDLTLSLTQIQGYQWVTRVPDTISVSDGASTKFYIETDIPDSYGSVGEAAFAYVDELFVIFQSAQDVYYLNFEHESQDLTDSFAQNANYFETRRLLSADSSDDDIIAVSYLQSFGGYLSWLGESDEFSNFDFSFDDSGDLSSRWTADTLALTVKVAVPYAQMDRISILENTEVLTDISWLFQNTDSVSSDVFFSLNISDDAYQQFQNEQSLDAFGRSAVLLTLPIEEIEEKGLTLYYRNVDEILTPIPTVEWQLATGLYVAPQDISEIFDGVSPSVSDDWQIAIPIFEDGSERDFDGIENERVLYKLSFSEASSGAVLVDDSYTYNPYTQTYVSAEEGVLANDTLIEAVESIEVVQQPTYSTIVLNTDGSFSVELNDYTYEGQAADSFTYRVVDEYSMSRVVTVSLNYSLPPQVLTANIAQQQLNEDGAVSFDIYALDTEQISWTNSSPENGELVLSANSDGTLASVSYVPVSDFYGTDSVVISLTDELGDVTTQIIEFEVNEVNDTPIGVDDEYVVTVTSSSNVGFELGVLNNDLDEEGNVLSAVLTTSPIKGDISFNSDGSFIYTHTGTQEDAGTSDSFSYRVSDGYSESSIVTVELMLEITDEVARAFDDTYTGINEGELYVVEVGAGVLSNDESSAGVSIVTAPSYGTLVLSNDGAFEYQHDGSESTEDYFIYQLTNSHAIDNTAQVDLIIDPLNDRPVIFELGSDQVFAAQELIFNEGGEDSFSYFSYTIEHYQDGSALTIEFEAEDLDSSDVVWSFDNFSADVGVTEFAITFDDIVDEESDNHKVQLNIDIPLSYLGDFGLAINVTDDADVYDIASINVTVINEDLKPDVIYESYALPEAGTTNFNINYFNDGVDIIVINDPVNGSYINEANTISYVHNGTQSSDDALEYYAYDGADYHIVNVSFDIELMNDAPVFTSSAPVGFNWLASQTYTYNITVEDEEGDALTLEVLALPSWLAITQISDSQWRITGVPTSFAGTEDVVSLKVSDGSAEVMQNFTILIPDDIDGDGILNTSDSFPFNASENADFDSDGIGDNADSDDDNDEVSDINDAFPYDRSESQDTDNDGIGNNADLDDDNDGIEDVLDDEPLVAETTPPDFDLLDVVTFEATGVLTFVTLATPIVNDDNSVDIIMTTGVDDGLAIGTHVITWTAVDFAGNQSTAEQTVIVQDTTAPIIEPLAQTQFNSTGNTTDVSPLLSVTAFDIVDGAVDVSVSDTSTLSSGRHEIELLAEDAQGNQVLSYAFIDILPKWVVPSEMTVFIGSENTLSLSLDGEAPEYPASVGYSVLREGSVITNGQLSIAGGQLGSIPIALPDDIQDATSLVLQLSNGLNSFVGEQNQTELLVSNDNVSPSVVIQLSQDGVNTSIIDIAGGAVVLTAVISDANTTDSHRVDWLSNEANLNDLENSAVYSLDPSELAEGIISLTVRVQETNTSNTLSILKDVSYLVATLTELDALQDSDGDGKVDSEEGYGDSDGDGIFDYLDDNALPFTLPAEGAASAITTSPNLQLRLGSITGKNIAATNANMTLEFMQEYYAKTDVDFRDSNYESLTSIYNFVVDGLSDVGDTVAIVIPLPEGFLLPANSVYRKFAPKSGWYSFVENSNNALYSSITDENGNCPSADEDDFNLGLIEGAQCVLLIIEDGGPNDLDGLSNASIEDPGAFAIDRINTVPIVVVDDYESAYVEGDSAIFSVVASDAEDDELTYEWAQISGPTLVLNDISSAQLQLTVPKVDQDEEVLLSITVSDGGMSTVVEVNFGISDIEETIAPAVNKRSGGGVNIIYLLLLFMFAGIKRLS